MSLNQFSSIVFICSELRVLYYLWGSLVPQELFSVVHEIDHLACDTYQMFTAHKTYEGLLISLLEDGPQNIVGYGFLTSDERGHLFFT